MKNTIALKDSNDFQHILKKGRWAAGDMMSLYILPNTEEKNLLGIAVGKKFSKSSVKRNRVKRLIKEAYRLNETGICKGFSMVILWKNNVNYESVTYGNVCKDLLKCLKKADVLIKEEEYNA